VIDKSTFSPNTGRLCVAPFLFCVAAIAMSGFHASAQTTWDGAGEDDNWSTGENWDGDDISPSPGTTIELFFGGGTRLTPNNDYAESSDFKSILFNSGAGSFTIRGNSINFYAGKIENNSSVPQSLDITSFSFNSGRQFINPANGDLSLGGGGNISNNGQFMDVFGNNGHTLTLGKTMDGAGGLSINQNSIVNLTAGQIYTGDTLLDAGSLRIDAGGSLGATIVRLGASGSSPTLYISDIDGGTSEDVAVVVRGSGGGGTKIIGGLNTSGVNTFSGPINLDENVTFSAATGGRVDFSGQIVDGLGEGNFRVSVDTLGTVQLTGSGANSGTDWTVQAGTLELSKDTGVDAVARSLTVETGGVVSLLANNQVNDSATVSLSGGTIQRGNGVSETFGALTLEGDSFLDFGSGTTGNMTFGIYEGGTTPSNLLTVNRFAEGNTLVFGNNVGSFLPTGGALSNAYFSFNNGFTYNSSTFTITAIPEPSTYLAAAGLFALFLWPIRRRLLQDAKFLLGLRPTGRA